MKTTEEIIRQSKYSKLKDLLLICEAMDEARQLQREQCCQSLINSPTASNLDRIKVLTAGINPKHK